MATSPRTSEACTISLAMKRSISLLVVLAAMPSLAQEVDLEALKKLPPLPFKQESAGNLPGVVVAIDEAFATQNENKAPDAPFTIVVPTGKNLSLLPGGRKTGNPDLVQLGTARPDKRSIEMLRLASMSVPLQPDPADRLKLCSQLLKSQGQTMATKDYKDVRFLDAYATKIGGYDAVCLHGQMTKVGSGEQYAVKLAGILHPSQKGGVLATLMADTKLSAVKKPEELSSNGLGLTIIHSVKFIEPAKAAAKP